MDTRKATEQPFLTSHFHGNKLQLDGQHYWAEGRQQGTENGEIS